MVSSIQVGGQWYRLIGILILVILGAFVTYPFRLFGSEEGVAFVIGYMAAVVYGASTAGAKLLSPKTAWLYKSDFVLHNRCRGPFIRYVLICSSSVFVGTLMYILVSFDPTEMEYSWDLYIGAHLLAALIAVSIVVLSWVVSYKI